MKRCRLKTGLASGRRLLLPVLLFAVVCVPVQAQQHELPVGEQLQPAAPALEVTAAPVVTPDSVARVLSPDDAREDLTVFFAIGIVIDLLLLTLFLVWAMGQWRKSRK